MSGWCDAKALCAAGPPTVWVQAAFDLSDQGARYHLGHDAQGLASVVVHFADRCQIGLCLRPDLRGQGAARAVLHAALATLGEQPLFAVIAPENTASLRLFARAGFRDLTPPDRPGPRLLTLP